MTKQEVIAEVRGMIDGLQVWFASRPYGFRETASPQQLQQWDDRVKEEEYLLSRLETLRAE